MSIKAVIFDMDGLLVDTETVAAEVATQICADMGIELTPAEQKQIVGVTAAKFFRELIAERNLDLDLEKTVQKFNSVYEHAIMANLRPFIGATSLPKQIKEKGIPMAIVSGSTERQVDIILTQIGIQDLFDHIVAADDITHSKPDPEGYLKAAKLLGVDPSDCVVLEDASAGVRAAKEAGMRVIGVRNNGEQDLSMADQVVDNLLEVPMEVAV